MERSCLRVEWIWLFLLISASTVSAASNQLQEQQHYNDYTVKIYFDTNTSLGSFEIVRSGKQVFFEEGQFFKTGNANPEPGHTNLTIQIGQTITGTKQPNLVLTGWTSGNHCCTTFYVFELGRQFKLLDKIEALYFGTSEFADLKGDGNLRLVTVDGTFAYWNVPASSTHCPTVILKYHNERYVLDSELMRKPAPTESELKNWAAGFKGKFSEPDPLNEWPAPPEMWQKMLDLIYSGNMESAWRLCELSWTGKRKGEFLRAFRKQLSTSPYAAVNQPGFEMED